MIKLVSKIKEITIFIADSNLVFRMERRLNEILRVLWEFIKIRHLVEWDIINKILERSDTFI